MCFFGALLLGFGGSGWGFEFSGSWGDFEGWRVLGGSGLGFVVCWALEYHTLILFS